MIKWICLSILLAAHVHAQKQSTFILHDGEPDKESGRIMDTVKNRGKEMDCVTPQAIRIYGPLSTACAQMPSSARIAAAGPHADSYINVYITPASKKVLLEGKGVYPVGTLIVKEKSSDASGKDIELFTAMIKLQAGYNPEVGDWEFLVLDKRHRIVAHGKLDSCIDCHRLYPQSDFVARGYLPKAARSEK